MNPAASPPCAAVAPGPAAESPPARFSPLTEKCAFATRAAFGAGEAAERALWACENAIDEAKAAMVKLEAARVELTAAALKLRDYQRDLNNMASAFLTRATAKGQG